MRLLTRKGSIIATSVYIDGVISADSAEITTPEIVHKMLTMDAMGDVDVPIPGRIEAMKLGIKTPGADHRMSALGTPVAHTVVINAVQQVVSALGTNTVEQVKITATGFGTKVPSGSFKAGDPAEGEYEASCTAYKQTINGEVVCDINVLAGKEKINGIDYGLAVNALL